MIEKMEEMLGRALTERERNNVNWLLGWDKETIETFNELFAAFFKAGQEDANFSRAAIELGERRIKDGGSTE